MITQARLKELLHYNPTTGKFSWLSRPTKKVGYAWTSSRNKSSYLLIGLDYKIYKAHRLAWLYVYGDFPSDQIDHVDGNGLNNAISNLRSVTAAENCRNRPRYSSNKSGVVGVFWHTGRGSYTAKIMVDGKHKHLLSTKDFFDAVCARKSAEILYGFHPNCGR